jgi:hypothetical protein
LKIFSSWSDETIFGRNQKEKQLPTGLKKGIDDH